MSKNTIENLVIVESPAKAKTIEKFLGDKYTVKSSFGHIRDLSKKDLGVDIKNNFTPQYEVSADKKSLVKELKGLAGKAGTVWLASDEDREGEAIAWHLAEVLGLNAENTKRIAFHEITKDAIIHAVENPRDININLVNAQQARRVLDRLVGFEVSPVLWKKVKPSLSAGRVQSVAVKLIVEREREINAFKSQPQFTVTGTFVTPSGEKFKASLQKRFDSEAEAEAFLESCRNAEYTVTSVEKKPSVRKPAPPFTTSTLQQEASRKLGLSVSQTMSIAQKLYEHGFITYMRTDSVNLSDLALGSSKKIIVGQFGAAYSKTRRFTTSSKGAQEAHEAIRPTYMDRTTIDGDRNETGLYELIYKRTLASQMTDARLERNIIEISLGNSPYKFEAVGETILFDGFLKVYMESHDDETDEFSSDILPEVESGEKVDYREISAKEQYTQHPPRYTEASLVKKMEALGIGRPSTYAPTITTIQNRGYIIRESREGKAVSLKTLKLSGGEITSTTSVKNIGGEKKKLFPSDIGIVVTDFLNEYFADIMDYNFTANTEEALDNIAMGTSDWHNMLKDFYKPFHEGVENTLQNSERNNGLRMLGNDPATGLPVCVRIGRFGPIAQIGEGENIRYAGLQKGQLVETITLEEALALFKFPRELGEFEGKTVSIGIGRFGPYIKHNGVFVSLNRKEDSPGTITLDEAVERIQEKRAADKEKIIAELEDGIIVIKGRFGPYISYNKKNYKIPKGTAPEKLDKENCMMIIEKEDSKKTVSKTRKKTTKRSTSK